MFEVTIHMGFEIKRFKHTQKKIALRQFAMYKMHKIYNGQKIDDIHVLHLTKRIDEVVATWSKN